MFIQRSQIIVDEPFKMRSEILQSISECHGDEENTPILPILTLKLVAMATSLERSEKEGQILNL